MKTELEGSQERLSGPGRVGRGDSRGVSGGGLWVRVWHSLSSHFIETICKLGALLSPFTDGKLKLGEFAPGFHVQEVLELHPLHPEAHAHNHCTTLGFLSHVVGAKRSCKDLVAREEPEYAAPWMWGQGVWALSQGKVEPWRIPKGCCDVVSPENMDMRTLSLHSCPQCLCSRLASSPQSGSKSAWRVTQAADATLEPSQQLQLLPVWG